jgi:uncharacterized phage protein gp47/JayE
MDKETIQSRMLSNINDSFDKSEGSFFYDVIKPMSIELEQSYIKQEDILDKGFVETSTGIYLDRKVSEQGLVRKQATKATTQALITGNQGTAITKGDIVASDTVSFIIMENKIIDSTGQANVLVECEQAGSIGNVPAGSIKYFPITIQGLISVVNLTAVSNGYNGETDEELRNRYYEKLRTPSTSGNKYHYLNWTKEIVGVGDAKCFPLWNGNGTVKVVIVDSNKRAANTELINKVMSHIEEERPIGATATVTSAIEKPINVTATVILANGYTIAQVQGFFQNALIEYFKEISFKETYISYAKIGSILLSLAGVGDYSNLKINSGISNILLGVEDTPVLGSLVLGV